MERRPRICPQCGKDIPAEAEVTYSAAGIFHDRCYQKFSRKGGSRR